MKIFLSIVALTAVVYPQSFFSNGIMHVMSSSHQDIGWEDTPAACAAYRDTAVIAPALELLKSNPRYCYSVEATLSLLEYLDKHPEDKDDIEKLIESGRLEWGASYTQPYESMYDGEALIRQMYLGRKLLMDIFPNSNPRVYWNADIPGRAMQMPQILAKSGIDYMLISRHGEGFFRWASPDGSSIVAWSPGHYYNASRKMLQELDGQLVLQDSQTIAETYRRYLAEWTPYYQRHNLPPIFGVLLSRDMLRPLNLDDFFIEWNEKVAPAWQLPKMSYSTLARFLDNVMAKEPDLKEIVGERPNLWLYIHGPTHHRALQAGRDAWRLLVAAEKFATIAALLADNWDDYPQDQFKKAWMDAIYPDHGWGGVNGHITDRIFREKFESARDAGVKMLNNALKIIAQKIKRNSSGIPLVVFNPLSWQRSEPVRCTLNVEGRAYPHLGTDLNYKVVNASGEPRAHQFVSSYSTDPLDEELCLTFIADDIPAIGYKTFYVVPMDSTDKKPPIVAAPENDFYRIELGRGGVKSIFDKQLGIELLRTDKFLGGELFSMQSVGEGAGEWTLIQMPTMEDFEKASDFSPCWNLVQVGPVYNAWEYTQRMNHVTVRQQLILYHAVKRIDFLADLSGWDGSLYREFRLAFPLNMEEYTIAYKVPMGVVEVGVNEIEGAAGKAASYIDFTQSNAEVHPREVQDWFHANNGEWGVTMSSSVAVFDWLDPTSHPVAYPILQPLLLSSRRSCNQKGNWYLQAGDHFFRFSLTSHPNDWRGDFQSSVGAAQPLAVLVDPPRKDAGYLPESYSFFSVDPSNVIISAIKKCEQSNDVILRLYEIEGVASSARVRSFVPTVGFELLNMIEQSLPPLSDGTDLQDMPLEAYSIKTWKIKK
ncbi:hypothetical protein JXA70_20115 [candidate division KSB1 bacterium]|nr:hypothetical protein [candidate division KSB1 bacterium]